MADIQIRKELQEKLDKHPCYCEKAHYNYARIHLPVAPKCNIQCNYCNRKYDCVNESRPGVTSDVLTPEAALEKFRMVKAEIPNLSVAAIAGPGDFLANVEESFRTMELIHAEFPDVTLCLSTNGLYLPKYIDRLVDLGVEFITVTINAVDPEVAKEIYEFVVYEGKVYRGREAAEVLLRNQWEGVRMAIERGVLVKINTVMIPEVNADHIPEISKRAQDLGAYIHNILPLIPVEGTRFENKRAPTARERKDLQDSCEGSIRQMRHCKMCRADAIGLLGNDRSGDFTERTRTLVDRDNRKRVADRLRTKEVLEIAVASSDGREVDLGFGQAATFWIFKVDGNDCGAVGTTGVDTDMDIPLIGEQHRTHLEKAVSRLSAHDVIVASEFGDKAISMIEGQGMRAIVATGRVNEAAKEALKQVRQE